MWLSSRLDTDSCALLGFRGSRSDIIPPSQIRDWIGNVHLDDVYLNVFIVSSIGRIRAIYIILPPPARSWLRFVGPGPSILVAGLYRLESVSILGCLLDVPAQWRTLVLDLNFRFTPLPPLTLCLSDGQTNREAPSRQRCCFLSLFHRTVSTGSCRTDDHSSCLAFAWASSA